ncbi:MAG: hypothetical protein D6785_10270 [Planctomycetota bacterium]|nr:MAG: hypothetical protein D6785_10270 [Planctomycetota bacterium]
MSEEKKENGASEQEEKTSLYQEFLDNPWILLLLGILVPTLSYTLWGLIEMFMRSPAKLP